MCHPVVYHGMKTPSSPGAAKRNTIEPTTGMMPREGWSMTGPLRPNRNASELLEESEPVQLDPILFQLAVGEAADDDDGPRHVAAGCGDPLPFALLGRLPAATPDASVAGEEHIIQGVGGVRKGAEKAFHRRAPGRQVVDRLHAQPVRCQIVIP